MVVVLTVSIKGAGVMIKYVSSLGACFVRHLSAGHAGARLRCTISLGGILSVCRVGGARVRNYVVSSMIPRVAGVIGLTTRGVLGGGTVILKPNMGAKLGVVVSGPKRLNTSRITSTITKVTNCPIPLVLVSVKATAATSIIGDGGRCMNKVVLPNMKISLSTLATETSRLDKVDVSTPERIVKGGAVRYVGDKILCDGTTTLSKVVSEVRRRLKRGTAMITANNLTGGVIPRYGERVVLSRRLLLENLLVVCRGGGWRYVYVRVGAIRRAWG